jgi:AraC-like DNA-binding protein
MPDPLSDLLALIEMESVATARLEAGGDWALRFPAKPYLKFNAVLKGHCWIAVDGAAPLRLDCGDTFLMNGAPGFVLSGALSEPGQIAGDGAHLFANVQHAAGRCIRYGGDDTVVVGGGFTFAPVDAVPLLATLPAFMHLPGGSDAAAILRGTLALLDSELAVAMPGASLMVRRLADILLVQALRAHAALQGAERSGWIGALGDRRIGAALRSMHGDLQRRWRVAELAAVAGMSRSGFALRFRQVVGCAPLDYMTQWRMHVALSRLRQPGTQVAVLAAQLGYCSESAFGTAFKRQFGCAPRRYGMRIALEQQNGAPQAPAAQTSRQD